MLSELGGVEGRGLEQEHGARFQKICSKSSLFPTAIPVTVLGQKCSFEAFLAEMSVLEIISDIFIHLLTVQCG